MLNSGYYDIAEVAIALLVSVAFVEREVEQENLRFTLTLYGEPQFFCRDIQRWIVRRREAIQADKVLTAKYLEETVGR